MVRKDGFPKGEHAPKPQAKGKCTYDDCPRKVTGAMCAEHAKLIPSVGNLRKSRL